MTDDRLSLIVYRLSRIDVSIRYTLYDPRYTKNVRRYALSVKRYALSVKR